MPMPCTTRYQAEAALAALGSSWDWLPGEMLRTVTKPMAALLTETRGGREVFFTAAESTFNHLAAEAESTAAEAAAAPLRPLKAITYGDGAPLVRRQFGEAAEEHLSRARAHARARPPSRTL